MLTRYESSELMTERIVNVQVYKLQDKEADLSVTVSPSEGGQVSEMIFRGENILHNIPVMFPWPNRMAGAKFEFKGRTVKLTPTTKEGYVFSSLVNKNWNVENMGVSKEGAHLEESLRSRDFPDIAYLFPYPNKITVDWIVREGTLEFATTVVNEGDETMPMGLGFHTNFNVPIRDSGLRENCFLMVPANSYWEKEDPNAIVTGRSIPTGRKLRVEGTKLDLIKPKLVKNFLVDDVLTDLRMENGWTTCKIYDPVADITVLSQTDKNFSNIGVFIPPSTNSVSIEPMTCATDAFNLESRNIKAGLIALEPGEKWTGTVKIIPKTGRLI